MELGHFGAVPWVSKEGKHLRFCRFFKRQVRGASVPHVRASTTIKVKTKQAVLRVSLSKATRLYRLAACLIVTSNFRVCFRRVVILQPPSRPMVRGHFLTTQRLLIMYVALILFLVSRRVIRRFPLFLTKRILRCYPMDLLRLTVLRRLIRAQRYLANLNGGGGATRKTIRPIDSASGSVSELTMLLFRMLLCDFQGQYVAHFISLGCLKDNLISCGSVVIFMCSDRQLLVFGS